MITNDTRRICEFKSIIVMANPASTRRFFYHQNGLKFKEVNSEMSGPGSSVIIATDYGLDGPGSSPGGDEIFRPSGPVLGPTQPPV